MTTLSPRPMLMKNASSFIAAKNAASNMPRVSRRQRRRVDDDVGARRERAVLVGEPDVLDVVGPFAAAVARRDHVHAEPVRALRDFRADAAQADDEQRLAFDLDRPLAAQSRESRA